MKFDVFEPDSEYDARLAWAATGAAPDALSALNQAGLLQAADVHVARRLGSAAGEDNKLVVLAIALAVRALRGGSVCIDLTQVDLAQFADVLRVEVPSADRWMAQVRESALHDVAIRTDGTRLYLDRYWREEQLVAEVLLARLAATPPALDRVAVEASATRLFPEGWEEQRAAAVAAAMQWTTVITGGPGTGKTASVAGLLALLAEHHGTQGAGRLRVALAAPTGKAAARLQESVAATGLPAPAAEWLADVPALTLHRLLGWRPDSRSRFKHDRRNRLGYDLIVVDESSMVPLTMMARLLEAIRPDTRLVLVGDPDQLTSVEAGAVLADLVAGLGARAPSSVARLTQSHRFGASIGAFAEAIRVGDADGVLELLTTADDAVSFVDVADESAVARIGADLGARAAALERLAETGDQPGALSALDVHRTLCAHREGPFGVSALNRRAERAIAEAIGVGVGASWGREWYAGRPVLVNTNDYRVGLFNGDVGITIREGDALRVCFPGGRSFATSRLGGVETMHALTIHKSQGGQADEITVVMPEEGSRLLTRELFYTAVTRAKSRVRIVGSLDAVRSAVSTPAARASGLQQRLESR